MLGQRTTTFFLPILLVGLILTGFGCKGQTAAEQAATKAVKLELWTVTDDVDALKTLIDQYHTARPYLTIQVRQLRPNEFYDRLVEALAEDKGPDIISVSNHAVHQYLSKLAPMPSNVPDITIEVQKGNFGDTTIVHSDTVTLPTVPSLDRDYIQVVKKDAVIDGKIYGLPLSADTLAMYYNKDLLDRSGVAEVPHTWDDFLAAVKKITRYNKTTGAIIQSGTALGTGNNISGFDDLLAVLFAQSNVPFTAANGRPLFQGAGLSNNNETGTILNFYTDYANPERDTYSWNRDQDDALERFARGSVGFFFGYNYQYNSIKAKAPQLNFRVVPMLQLNAEHPVSMANYALLSVTKKSRHQTQAWALINYLAHSGATKDYLKQSGRPTAARALIAEQLTKEELAPFASQLLVADNWYRGANYDAAKGALSTMLDEWLQTPPKGARENEWRAGILNRAAAKINQTL